MVWTLAILCRKLCVLAGTGSDMSGVCNYLPIGAHVFLHCQGHVVTVLRQYLVWSLHYCYPFSLCGVSHDQCCLELRTLRMHFQYKWKIIQQGHEGNGSGYRIRIP